MSDYDVVIVGYGPVGMTAAALLGKEGHRVAVVERYKTLFNHPRAASFDHEAARVLQHLGCLDVVLDGCIPMTNYDWCNAAGDVLIKFEMKPTGPMGWAESYLMYQPALEIALDRVVQSHPTVDVHRGFRACDLTQTVDAARVIANNVTTDERLTLDSRFVLACDGGNSFVREYLAIESEDFDFNREWLVVDLEMRDPVDLPISRQLCEPEQPGVMVQLGPKHRRWAFMILPDESVEEATDIDSVWRRLSRWITRDEMELVRVAPYTFKSRIATRWRSRRAFLVGDAAHEMPPFLGQGMCSGFRDANNLAWKLDLVLRGVAEEGLLDSYQLEREPHVRAITEKSIELGKVQTMRDPVAAARRDTTMLAARAALGGGSPDSLEFPSLQSGVLGRGGNGERLAAAGKLFIQGRVATYDRHGLFDDVVGRGPVIIGRETDPAGRLSQGQLADWASFGGHIVSIDASGSSSPPTVAVEDVEGTYTAWLESHDSSSVIVRPDSYVFGAVHADDELSRAVDQLLDQLGKRTEAPVT